MLLSKPDSVGSTMKCQAQSQHLNKTDLLIPLQHLCPNLIIILCKRCVINSHGAPIVSQGKWRQSLYNMPGITQDTPLWPKSHFSTSNIGQQDKILIVWGHTQTSCFALGSNFLISEIRGLVNCYQNSSPLSQSLILGSGRTFLPTPRITVS